MNRQPTFFDNTRMTLQEAIELTAQSLNAYGPDFDHWAIAYSGGKDSSATVAAVVHLIKTGRVKAPRSLTVCYADTRMELPPLHKAAMAMLDELRSLGITVIIVLPPMEKRFYVYMLGRGVPPPSNTFRWCTGQIKIQPMLDALTGLREQHGKKLLMLTGVRIGESAARDQRIAMSCGKNGAECGQGWFQEATPESIADTLAPLLHWRVCHVWDWLRIHYPEHGLPTWIVAEAYGGDEAEEINARTGCIACNLASKDLALDTILTNPKFDRLSALKELRDLYAELKKPHNRLRKTGHELTKAGKLVANPCRMGPLTLEARRLGLARVLDIQARAGVDLINAEEQSAIESMIAASIWPDGWSGTEQRADLPFENINPDGSVQPDFCFDE